MKSKPTIKQKRAVQNILGGQFRNVAEAMRDAGYSQTTSHRPKEKLANAKGVQAYLEQLGGKAIQKFGMSLEDKVAETYLEGLTATKLYGKNAIEHPDWAARKSFADALASFLGWTKDQSQVGNIHRQFNYFGVSEDQRDVFNKKFSDFLNKFYADKNSG